MTIACHILGVGESNTGCSTSIGTHAVAQSTPRRLQWHVPELSVLSRQASGVANVACYIRVFVDVTARLQLELPEPPLVLRACSRVFYSAAGCTHPSSKQSEAKPMPDTRNTQHPQQRPFSGAQRHRRHLQPPPQRCETEDGLSNLQSVLVNTAPCFPASNQVKALDSGIPSRRHPREPTLQVSFACKCFANHLFCYRGPALNQRAALTSTWKHW